jgi:regulation of enolase protein 1 (concanavalin A-like superfamily)
VRNLRDWAGNSMATAAVSIRGIRLSQSDVGNPTTAPLWPGQVFSWNGETFDIRGSGRDLGGTADGFSFLYREMEGDFEILTRVPVMDAPDFWVKAGLMVREDLSAGSRMAYVAVTPREGANRFYSAYRGAPGGNATLLGEFSPVPFPSAWLRIRRIGSTVMLASSNNGEHWITLGVPLVSFQPTVLVGICLAARDRDSFTASPLNATFADFKLQSIPVPALSMMFGEGMVIIRWPEWVIGSPYVLEEAEALLEDGIGWIPLNGATESTEYGVFLDPEQPVAQKFYRLSLPQF